MQLFFTMGMPAVITTDQGKEFHNYFNTEMMNLFGIKHRELKENRKFTCFCRIVPVFCHRRMPETFSREMIQCDQCLNWFHLDLCVPVANTCEKWFCKDGS